MSTRKTQLLRRAAGNERSRAVAITREEKALRAVLEKAGAGGGDKWTLLTRIQTQSGDIPIQIPKFSEVMIVGSVKNNLNTASNFKVSFCGQRIDGPYLYKSTHTKVYIHLMYIGDGIDMGVVTYSQVIPKDSGGTSLGIFSGTRVMDIYPSMYENYEITLQPGSDATVWNMAVYYKP